MTAPRDPYDGEYQKTLNALGIEVTKDPFPIGPPQEVDYWADNVEVLNRIVEAQVDSIMFASTSFYVFWGPLGVGKTFAAKYLSSPAFKEKLYSNIRYPPSKDYLVFRVTAISPLRTGQLASALYRDIIERCWQEVVDDPKLFEGIVGVAEKLPPGLIKSAFKDISRNSIRTLDGELNLEDTEGYRLLSLQRSRFGRIQDPNELVQSVGATVSLLLRHFERVVILVDEVENLARASVSERLLVSDFLRKLHDEVDIGLTLILIFTFDSYENVNSTLQPALLGRLRSVIDFALVRKNADLIRYINDCIKDRAGKKPSDVFESGIIDLFAQRLLATYKQLSFREINNEIHKLFATTYRLSGGSPRKTRYKVTRALYDKAVEAVDVRRFSRS